MHFLELSSVLAPEMVGRLRDIARRLGNDRDDADWLAESRRLNEIMFADIVATLGKRAEVGTFRSPNGIELAARAYPDARHAIVFDEALSRYFSRLALVCCAFALTSELEFAPARNLFRECDHLREMQQSGRYQSRGRDTFLQILGHHIDLWPTSVALYRAFTAFVICHEIAHHRLKHFDRTPAGRQEFAADWLACHYLDWLIAGSAATAELRLGAAALAAPLILLRAQQFLAPDPMREQRLQRLAQRLQPRLPAPAAALHGYVFEEFDFYEGENLRTLADFEARYCE